MAPSLRPPKVLDPGPMPRGRHRGAQSVGPGLRELPRTPSRRSSQNFYSTHFVNKGKKTGRSCLSPGPTTLRRPSGRESMPDPPTRRSISHILRRDEYRTLRQTCSLTSHQSRPQPKRGLHNDYPGNRPFSRQVFVKAITVLSRKKPAAAPRA
jgi:hypothetical protein